MRLVRARLRLDELKKELIALDVEFKANKEIIKNKVKGQIRKAQSRNNEIRERCSDIHAHIAVIQNPYD